MRRLISILLLFQTVNLIGQIEMLPIQEDTLRNGVEEHAYENGELRTSYTFKKGKLDGKMSKWYETGAKKIEGQFKDDLPIGTFRAWYPSGQLMAEVPAVNGMLQEDLASFWTSKGKRCNKNKAKRLAEKVGF